MVRVEFLKKTQPEQSGDDIVSIFSSGAHNPGNRRREVTEGLNDYPLLKVNSTLKLTLQCRASLPKNSKPGLHRPGFLRFPPVILSPVLHPPSSVPPKTISNPFPRISRPPVAYPAAFATLAGPNHARTVPPPYHSERIALRGGEMRPAGVLPNPARPR